MKILCLAEVVRYVSLKLVVVSYVNIISVIYHSHIADEFCDCFPVYLLFVIGGKKHHAILNPATPSLEVGGPFDGTGYRGLYMSHPK